VYLIERRSKRLRRNSRLIREPQPAGLGVVKSRRFAAGAAMPVNEAEFARSHLPGLLDNSGHRLSNKIARPMAVQVGVEQGS
jgi:hypothetical protein